jgi:hypothetical protein
MATIPPTVGEPTTADLQFISTSATGSTVNTEAFTTIPLGGAGAGVGGAGYKPYGPSSFAGSSYLSDKGFGWLLELEEEEEEEENTSLL